MMKLLNLAAAGITTVLLATGANAATLTADLGLDFFDSGAGPLAGPYGGDIVGGGFPVALADTSNALDGDLNTFVSLPTGSFITVGFSGGFVFDGPGDDIFVTEVGGNPDEDADVFVSTDGMAFSFLGTVGTGGTETLDLATIGFTAPVNAVRVLGLGTGGGSPGYDLSLLQGLAGSVVTTTPVPLPAGGLLLLGALGVLGVVRRKQSKS